MRISIMLLSYDHGIIQIASDVLGEIAKRRILDKKRNETFEISVFLDKFLGKYHHTKEEKFLFPFAVKSDPSLVPDVDALISDHRRMEKLLSDSVSISKAEGAEADLYAICSEIAELSASHINKEERRVYPLIEAHLSSEEDHEIYNECKEFTDRNFGYDYLRNSESFAMIMQSVVLGPNYMKTDMSKYVKISMPGSDNSA